MPPSMVQIFNGIFVIAFAVPFSMLWDKLRANGKEPISPVKQAIGLALIALSYFIIANNVKNLGNTGLLAIHWLILLYLIQTFGELCLSPIGLSLVGKLAPKRFSSLLYGVFFLSNASGYALAGTLGSILPATGEQFTEAQKWELTYRRCLTKEWCLPASNYRCWRRKRSAAPIQLLRDLRSIICSNFLWCLLFCADWPLYYYSC